jgi:BirA family biotin operon repressor/biotin-[acetyl-CoA-carboxylase] ligase
MVNRMINTKEEIIKTLYLAQGKVISGVKLSNELKISRVAVWKHINALKESGVCIESRPRGYVLSNHDDLLMPFCFKKEFQNRICHFQELDSTMDKAKSLAKNDAQHLSVVIAENQTKGRGRLNRQWFSSNGGLWFTLILKPTTPVPLAYIYNFAASLSLCRSLKKLFDVDVSVKWPNDLLLDGKKIVGLLSEMSTYGDMLEFLNIGIGINVNNHPQKYEPKSISLKDVLNKTVSRKKILETFLDDFSKLIQNIDCKTIIEQWKEQTSTISSQVRIETTGNYYDGYAVDVDETGALIIKTKTDEIKKIIYGDCFHT